MDTTRSIIMKKGLTRPFNNESHCLIRALVCSISTVQPVQAATLERARQDAHYNRVPMRSFDRFMSRSPRETYREDQGHESHQGKTF